jgi:polyhydroxyalkanoate synthesis regulator phasin
LTPPQHIWTNHPSLHGLTNEEAKDVMDKWLADNMLKQRIATYEYIEQMARQATKNELRVNEAQWRIIEPKYKKQIRVMADSWARSSSGHSEKLGPHWIKPTESESGKPKTFAELSEAYRNVEKLVDLVRREDTTDEEFRKQIDALQQAREKARKEWPKAKRELAAVLTTPRQEAAFLLIGYID